MNEETASGGELSSSWCLVNGKEATPAESPHASPAGDQLPSPASSSDHSDFEIFDEDEGSGQSEPPEPPPPPPTASDTEGELSNASGAQYDPPKSSQASGEVDDDLQSSSHTLTDVPQPVAVPTAAPEPPRLYRAMPPRQARFGVARSAQERRLLLALRNLRGDGATGGGGGGGSATPSPMEPPVTERRPVGHVTVRQEPPRVQIIQHSAEEESLPESDIQIEDSQNFGAGPELIDDLMEGDRVRRYQHLPNPNLNARLNGLVMCAVLFVLGLAMGHFLGSTHERFSNHFERVDRNDRIKSIQTELLQCARKYDELELQLNEVKATLVQKEYVDKWESLYQEGEEEKAALTATMNLYKSRYNTQKQLLLQCELKFQEMEEKIAKEQPRNLRCQPCPTVDLSCPRELSALKESMRALLQLQGTFPAGPLPCHLRALLPSWPALRSFVSSRLHNATTLLMESLPTPPKLANTPRQVKEWLAHWTKIRADLMRSPKSFWSKLTGQKDQKEAKGTLKVPPKSVNKTDEEKHDGKSNEAQKRTEEKNTAQKVDEKPVTVLHLDSQNHTSKPSQPHHEKEPKPSEKREQQQVNWFLRRKTSNVQTDDENDANKAGDGYWFWRRKAKIPPTSTAENVKQPPATRPPTKRAKQERRPPATKKTDTERPSASKVHDEQRPPSTKAEDAQRPVAPAASDTRPPVIQFDDAQEPPVSIGEDWPSPGDFDDEVAHSDWLEAFMQLREQMVRAQLRIWRSLKQMAAKMTPPRKLKKPKKKRKKRHRKKKQKWSWESEGE